MKRPTLQKTYMDMCKVLARRSHHPKTKVGCIITSFDNQEIYSCGYNGVEAGGNNHIDSEEQGESGSIHAELNAIARCRAPRSEEKNVYITHSPCIICARMIINLGGVKRIYYFNDYRSSDGIKLLNKHSITTIKL